MSCLIIKIAFDFMTWNTRSSEFAMYLIQYLMNLLNKYIFIYCIIYINIFLYLGKFVGHALPDLHALTARHC